MSTPSSRTTATMKLLAASLVLSAFVLVLLCPQWASCEFRSTCPMSCGREEDCVLDLVGCSGGTCSLIPICVPKKDVPVCSAVCPPQQLCEIVKTTYTPECFVV
ncbi:uncharacterized protein LOC110838382 [Zootermopsis nevadensis]|uniref:Uncharacterized protein n=1 Tax=Zootermopsis nevadensis TaxID=136037 RepID=A0A067QLE6_ZOONE|nr:uncharacterized protein LOC110838382 [Zootermopsis nevadensis]KDR09938.1 hypothetical protein L798_00426 [Zootermopsis nevadensis]